MADVDKIALCTQARWKRCGMAAVAAPKNVQGEREKRKRREERKRKEEKVLNYIHHSWTLCQFYSICQKRSCYLNGDHFFILEFYRKVCIKSCKLGFENCKDLIASEGAHPPQTALFKQGRSVKCY